LQQIFGQKYSMAETQLDRSQWWLILVGGIGGALITAGFNYLSHQNDLDAKMIELSIGILRSEPKQETEPLREWAIDVFEKRGSFSFNDRQRATLLKKELPFKGGFWIGSLSPVSGTVIQQPTPGGTPTPLGGGGDIHR
jgi:hypothetical protein